MLPLKNSVKISINTPPEEPMKPTGEVIGRRGKSYLYSTSAIDPDGDMIKCGWDWNGDDNVDEWTGFYPSGVTINIYHTWEEQGAYSVKVIAEDERGAQSQWSESVSVKMPKNKPYCLSEQISKLFTSRFPALNHLLQFFIL